MVHLTGQFARPFRRVAPRPAPLDGTVAVAAGVVPAGVVLRVPAVRREMDAAETGELLLTSVGRNGDPVAIQWQRHGRPAIALEAPYRLDRVDLKGSHRARLHGLTAGIRLVCSDWSPLFLIAPAQLPVLACAAATSRVG
ncbi:hypothetical protein [Kitasatospora sp. MAP5-34]|uniref:hypothetical protein n=1 Tax=Kitasatospora sp. MAP5-34 TaxID=3035102 RepID=UPI002473B811|nr:hypothetical protein [Kitasatospora sp. MAP5-34]MDH6577677.1 hypothetical protein [Kitasatospora sp. MAP5-34]